MKRRSALANYLQNRNMAQHYRTLSSVRSSLSNELKRETLLHIKRRTSNRRKDHYDQHLQNKNLAQKIVRAAPSVQTRRGLIRNYKEHVCRVKAISVKKSTICQLPGRKVSRKLRETVVGWGLR